MSDHKYHFNVTMTCSGCSGAVNRVLGRLEGVKNVDISLENQTVDVQTVSTLDYDTVFQTISKTGKKVLDGKIIE
ncbi:metal homeostasis factor Atx1p [[Candida] anglica]|uniref:Metal homeostasis factor Atx1p n=1 Tax=[Candida] anglica TaxID=148631 RepID=A0ABP0EGM1_9ASCO